MAYREKYSSEVSSEREAYQQVFSGTAVLLDANSLPWIERFLLRRVNILSRRKLDQLGESNSRENDAVSRDTIIVGDIVGGNTIAIGRGAIAGVAENKDRRDEQYEIVKHWDGHTLLRGFDLSERDLSGLNLAKADLRKANLKAADLSKANLVKADLSETVLSAANLLGADLSGANLNKAKYTENTIWPEGFDPEKAGAALIDSEKSA